MTTLHKASVGTVSEGTLRTEDLLNEFHGALESFALLSGDYLSTDHELRDKIANVLGEAQDCFGDDGETILEDKQEEASDMVNETLPGYLQLFAPPYCNFGNHPGDGADFGFWPDMESISELPTVEDSDGAKALGEDCKSVNDHGNVTVYGGDGTILLELV